MDKFPLENQYGNGYGVTNGQQLQQKGMDALMKETLAGELKNRDIQRVTEAIQNAKDPVEARTIAEQAISDRNVMLDGDEVKGIYSTHNPFNRFSMEEYMAAAQGGISPRDLNTMADQADAQAHMSAFAAKYPEMYGQQ